MKNFTEYFKKKKRRKKTRTKKKRGRQKKRAQKKGREGKEKKNREKGEEVVYVRRKYQAKDKNGKLCMKKYKEQN